jgi:hypothetical protein
MCEFSGDRALMPVNPGQMGAMQIVANHFKNYVQFTNETYTAELVKSQRRQAETQRRALQEEINRQEALQRMRESVRSIKL